MLAGTRYLMLDQKGRVIVPTHFRSQLGASFVITRAPDRCLLLLSAERWAHLSRKNADTPDFREFFLSGAVHVTPDPASGRILIPVELREWAGMRGGQEVALAGLGSSLAVSPRSVWDARLRRIETGLLRSLDTPPPALWTARFTTAEGRAL